MLDLPQHLLERIRWCNAQAATSAGRWVLYWMHWAMRLDENPAYDTACLAAAQLGLPLLIYQGFRQDTTFDSDRHHTFGLQGAREVQQQCQQAGVSYVLHVASRNDPHSPLLEVAGRSAIIVTEDMPVAPGCRVVRMLSRRVPRPLACVDTACALPMQVVGQAYTRAFEFRLATQQQRAVRLAQPWPQLADRPRMVDLSQLPFTSLNLSDRRICDVVAECDIDHGVGPVLDTCGGTAAGYRRWERFRDERLADYAQLRNDPLSDGSSRLSAYLHYGMISPFRIAREAADRSGAGADKFLDELLVWRELAYCFCRFRPDHERWSALPTWAQKALQAGTRDPRPYLHTWEELSRGQTHDPWWNAAQQSLVRHGGLHNNLRMTWGKAILNWTRSPQQALRMLIDLNHRFALDGRDPASYGGILWCLGQFDRPFQPPQPILGTVRPRPTAGHAQRLDVKSMLDHVSQLQTQRPREVAVVGAGLAGCIAARTLADHGLNVTVFEKSRGAGGRMAHRDRQRPASFDHGAQYFTVRNRHFRRFVESWQAAGHVAPWPAADAQPAQRIVCFRGGRIVSQATHYPRYVGQPNMRSVVEHLATSLRVVCHTPVAKVVQEPGQLALVTDTGEELGRWDRVIVAVPAPQAAQMLVAFPELTQQLASIDMHPCWAVMASFAQPLNAAGWGDEWVAGFVEDSPVAWAARNGTKPMRNRELETLVLHATPQWSKCHLEDRPEEVASYLLEAFWRASGVAQQVPQTLDHHRWRYALPTSPGAAGCYTDASERVVVCGDWAAGARVEGAFLSGRAAAGRILSTPAGIFR